MQDQELNLLLNKFAAEQRIEEVTWFYRAAEAISPKTILEIGTKEGGNLKILSTLLSEEGLAIGIDKRKKELVPWKMDDAICEIAYLQGDSHDKQIQRQLKKLLGDRPLDVLFIDGDHSYKGMLQDFTDYSPFVRPGGVIAVHDIFYLEPVTLAWKDLPVSWPRFESEHIQSSIGIGYVIKE